MVGGKLKIASKLINRLEAGILVAPNWLNAEIVS